MGICVIWFCFQRVAVHERCFIDIYPSLLIDLCFHAYAQFSFVFSHLSSHHCFGSRGISRAMLVFVHFLFLSLSFLFVSPCCYVSSSLCLV